MRTLIGSGHNTSAAVRHHTSQNLAVAQRAIQKRAAVGEEFRVNTYTTGNQTSPDIAGLTGGEFVIVWNSIGQDSDSGGIYGQLYDGLGGPLSTEFIVNTETRYDQTNPSVASLTGGGFVVVWDSYVQQGGSNYGIYGQLYDAIASRIGAEFMINTYNPGIQRNPAVAGLIGGEFIVVWESDSQDSFGYSIHGQLYDGGASTIGSEFQSNTYTAGDQRYPSVASLTEGGFVVAWTSYDGQDGSGAGIFGQAYDALAAVVGTEFQSNTYIQDDQIEPSVTGLENDEFVVVWSSYGQEGSNSSYGVYGQRYDSVANRAGVEFPINTYTADSQACPSVASVSNGTFAVVWNSNGQDGSGYGVYGQLFDSSGGSIGIEFSANIHNVDRQGCPSVTGLANNSLAVTWPSRLQDGSDDGVYARILEISLAVNAENQFYKEDEQCDITTMSVKAFYGPTPLILTLNMSDVSAGVFSTYYQSATATDSFDSALGRWQLYGDLNGVNELLRGFLFTPKENYNADFSVNVFAVDGLVPDFNTTIIFYGTSVNDPPELLNNSIAIGVGDTIVITAGHMSAIDVESTPDLLTFVIDPITYSEFQFVHNSTVTNVFTQQNVADGKIQFVHDGSDNAPAYWVSVSDGSDSSYYQQASVSFSGGGGNMAPILGNNQLTIDSGQTLVLSSLNLNATDPDGPDSTLFFIASSVMRGQFEHTNVPGVAVSSFLQSSIVNGDIQFVHYGGFAEPRYLIAVSDGVDIDGPSFAEIAFCCVAVSGEFLVNTYTNNSQSHPAVTGLVNGSFVIVWKSNGQDGSSYGVYGQLYDGGANRIGSEFLVNTHTSNSQLNTAAAGLVDGGFVVVWSSQWQDGSGDGVYGQLYNVGANRIGSEILVNTHTSSSQLNPAIAGLVDGGFVVVWQSKFQDGSNYGVYGQLYDAVANRVGDEFQVNTYTSDYQGEPSAAGLVGGGFVVVWESSGQDGSGDGVYGQLYNGGANRIGSEFLVNTHTLGSQSSPAAAGLVDGGFVVVWESSGQDGSGDGVYGQLYNGGANRIGSEFLVNTHTLGSQSSPAAAGLVDGGFVVVWCDCNVWDGNLLGRTYDGLGVPASAEFLLAVTGTSYVTSSVAGLPYGALIATWSDYDSSEIGVYARIFDFFLLEVRTNNQFYTEDKPCDMTRISVEALYFPTSLMLTFKMSDPSAGALSSLSSSETASSNFDVVLGHWQLSGDFLGINELLVGAIFTPSENYNSNFSVDILATDNLDQDYNTVISFYGTAVNDPPELRNNSLTVGVNGVVVITTSCLCATDVDSPQSSITFIIDPVTFGVFQFVQNHNVINIFTQQDVIDGGVQFVHDGSNNAPSYWVSASDGLVKNSYIQANVNFSGGVGNVDPVLLINQLAIFRGQQTLVLSNLNLYATDVDVPDGSLFFVTSDVFCGQFERVAEPGVPVFSFLQSNIASGDIVFVVHTCEQQPSYAVTVSDGIGMDGPYPATVIVKNREVEFRVNTYTAGYQLYPAASGLTGGGFVVVWESDGQDGSGDGVYGQLYDSAGNCDCPEFQVNTYTSGYQEAPSAAGLVDGGFVVVWQSDGQDGSSYGVYGQLYDVAGACVGPEFQVNTYTSDYQGDPSAAGLVDGGFVVVWYSNGQDDSTPGVYVQLYDVAGACVGPEFRENTSGIHGDPSAAGLVDGGFVVVCVSSTYQNGFIFGVYGHLYDAVANRVGDEFQVNTYTTSGLPYSQFNPAAVGLVDGGFVVVWQRDGQDGSGCGVYGQLYDAVVNRVGSEFLVNTYTNSSQTYPAAAGLVGGEFVVVWESYGQDGSGSSVYSKIYGVYLDIGVIHRLYTEDNPCEMTTISVVSLLSTLPLELTFTLLDPSAGIFASRLSSATAFEDFNTTLGQWRLSGELEGVNILLTSVLFTPSENYNADFSVDILVSYGFFRGLNETIIFHGAPVNDPPELINNGLSINVGETALITGNHMSAMDVDSPPNFLSFVIDSITSGEFQFVQNSTVTISFRQQDITDGKIQFVHDGSNNAPSYWVSVNDGQDSSAYEMASITFSGGGGNVPPVLGNNQLSIDEGQTIVMSGANIGASDQDYPDESLSFIIGNVMYGKFERVSAPGIPITSFPQSSVTSGDIIFIHDGDELAPSYDVTVSDGVGTDGPYQASITFTNVNDAPMIEKNLMFIGEGQTSFLTSEFIRATDVDNDDETLVFIVDDIQNAQFERATLPDFAVSSFTQQRVVDGEIVLVHDGGEVEPSYNISVSDGSLTTPSYASDVMFSNTNDAPELLNNQMNILEGGSVVVGGADLSAIDVDNDESELVFEVGAEQHGWFELVSNPGIAINRFSQGDVSAGVIKFVQDGGESEPFYSISVSDGAENTQFSEASITFTPVNDAPVIVNNVLPVQSGSNTTVLDSMLSASDEDNDGMSLIMRVFDVQHGWFDINAANISTEVFTQQQILNGEVSFVHSGILEPYGNITVSDGSLASPMIPIGFILSGQINQLPRIINNALTIDEGQEISISGNHISASDPDDDNAALIFSATNVQNGMFATTNNTILAVSDFSQQMISDGQIVFVHDGGEDAPIYDISVSDGKTSVGPARVSVQFSNINDEPYMLNNRLDVVEGQQTQVTTLQISATDVDNDDDLLTYKILDIQHGRFEFSGNTGLAIGSFTQQDVISSRVVFFHDGGESAPSFNISVTDGILSSMSASSLIGFTKSNDPPVLLSNQLTISEGDSFILSHSNVEASDIDNIVSDLRFEFGNVQNGHFEFTDTQGIPVSTVNYDNITHGEVVFVHNGDELAPSYEVTVNDGVGGNDGPHQAFVTYMNINDAPVLQRAMITLDEGDSAPLTSSEFLVSDVDSADGLLTFVVSNITHGQFEHINAVDVPINEFSQEQLTSGGLIFVHDGAEIEPSCFMAVMDGELSSDFSQVSFSFTNIDDEPVLIQNEMQISEGGTLQLTSFNIDSEDVDTMAQDVVLQVANVAGGYFWHEGDNQTSLTSFSQQDVYDGFMWFTHDGNEAAPAYSVSIRDGSTNLDFEQAQINFLPVNDAPHIVNNQVVIRQGQSVVITPSQLSATDPDNDDDILIFNVTNVEHGRFESLVYADVPITSFEQSKITTGDIQFIHDGQSAAPAFSFSISDEAMETESIQANIIFGGANNVKPVLVNNTLTINEGEEVVLSGTNLAAEDEDNIDEELIFNVGNIQHGRFELRSNQGNSITSFTQRQIIDVDVSFVHDGSELEPSYKISIGDGSAITTFEEATVFFTNVNDMPELTNNRINIKESECVTLKSEFVSVVDVDDEDALLKIYPSDVKHGWFSLTDNPELPIADFVQNQIINSSVLFCHDGNEFAPEYGLSVSDGDVMTVIDSAMVSFKNVNDAPILLSNNLDVEEGDASLLSSQYLKAVDDDNQNSSLSFNVNAVEHGRFEEVSKQGVPIYSFVQSQVEGGDIQFVHDGGELAPGYKVSVNDGVYSTDFQQAKINFFNMNDAPEVSRPMPPVLDAIVGEEFNYVVANDTFIDPDGDILSYELSSGDSSHMPSWLQFDADTAALSGAPEQTEETSLGIVASDPFNETARSDFKIAVSEKVDQAAEEKQGGIYGAVAGGVGAAVVLSATAVGIFAARRNQRFKHSRAEHLLADALRTELKLSAAGNFGSDSGLEYLSAVDALDNELRNHDINVDDMHADEVRQLSSKIAEAVRHNIDLKATCLGFSSSVESSELESNAEVIINEAVSDWAPQMTI